MIPNANTMITTNKVNMARRVLLFESRKKSVKSIRPKYKGESAHNVDLSRDHVLTVRMFRRRKKHLADLLKLQYILYFAREQ
jgi:hypothetical protein